MPLWAAPVQTSWRPFRVHAPDAQPPGFVLTYVERGMVHQGSLSELFWPAFKQSRNPMVLLDHPRRIVEVNGAFLKLLGYARSDLVGKPGYRFVVGGPTLSAREWAERLAVGHFTGETELLCANGSSVVVQWGVDTEAVTGSKNILLVALTTSRWGRHFRRPYPPARARTADRARTRGRGARGAGAHRAGDRGRAAYRPRHRSQTRPQRHDQNRGPLTRPPRRQDARRRPSTRLEGHEGMAQLMYWPRRIP